MLKSRVHQFLRLGIFLVSVVTMGYILAHVWSGPGPY